jgi:enterochelin esterase-like enzyme
MKSVLSRTIVAGVAIAATAGWMGVQSSPTTPNEAAIVQPVAMSQPGVRDRSAWQPSPIPSKTQGEASAAAPVAENQANPAPAISQPASAPPAALVAPALAAQTGQVAPAPAPFPGLGEWLRRLLKIPGLPTGLERDRPSAEAVPVIPMDRLFNADVLLRQYGDGFPAERGEWKTMSFTSRALGRDASYVAWLPPGYQTSGKTYPTLYLLHGVGSPEAYGVEEWLGYALTEDLDRMLDLGLIEPMIVILPSGEQGYWMNHSDGGPRWADYVAIDLVRHVDATFRTDARRERRGIGGLSMGGHGALQLAYNHPDVFSVAGAHSPTIRPYETSPEFFGDPKWFAQYDPVSLAKSSPGAMKVLTWIDVGSEDTWREGVNDLHAALIARRAPLEYRVLEGEHEGWYWQYYLPEYLHFYSSALHATKTTPTGAPEVANELLTSSVSVPANAAITHS